MLDLAGALARPVASLLLKSYLGDTAAEVAGNLYELAKRHVADRARAGEAEAKARAVAAAVVADLGEHLRAERVGEGDLNAAARELGVTLETKVSPAFLVGRSLDAGDIERELLTARPPERVFPGEPAPAEAYRRLVGALAPRLRAVAPRVHA